MKKNISENAKQKQSLEAPNAAEYPMGEAMTVVPGLSEEAKQAKNEKRDAARRASRGARTTITEALSPAGITVANVTVPDEPTIGSAPVVEPATVIETLAPVIVETPVQAEIKAKEIRKLKAAQAVEEKARAKAKVPAPLESETPPYTAHQLYSARFALRIAACETLPDAKVQPSQLPKAPRIADADVLALLARLAAAGISPGSSNAYAIARAVRGEIDLSSLKKA
jgi:hypothetical protein